MQMDEPGMQMLDGVADMVSIQPEATVSRTAMRTEGGNVVLFAFCLLYTSPSPRDS